jgi:AcrR family transcriptional regulator
MTQSEPQPVIWARLSGQGRGPTRTLDYETITAAAIAIADEEGLDAVTMRKIASRVGHSPMALYRHVGNKDDLEELMYDAALGELDLASGRSGDWRSDLAHLAGAYRRMHHRHPWMTHLGQRPTLGPNFIRLMEHAMACVDSPGRGIDKMVDMAVTVLHFTIGLVHEELAAAEAQRRTGLDRAGWHRRMTPHVTELLSAGGNPYLARMILEGEDFPDPDAVFQRRLAMVLDGLAAVVSAEREGTEASRVTA